MTNEIKLTVRPFEMDTLKEAAKKMQEEAGEAFAEYVILQEQKDRSTTRLADEIADTIQAACNLAARYGINLQSAMQRCEQRNRERGRYGDADTNGIRESSVGDTAIRRWMDSDSWGNNSPTCACDRSGVVDSDGSRDAHYKTTKSHEEMSVEELIEALSFAIDHRITGCGEGICEEWCDRYPTCADCRNRLLDLLETAYRQEVTRLKKSNDWLTSRCGQLEERVFELGKQVYRAAIIEQGLRNRGMHDMADEFADFHDVTEDAYAAFLALLKVDDGE